MESIVVPPRQVWRETAAVALLVAHLGLLVVMRAHALRDEPRSGFAVYDVAADSLAEAERTLARTLRAAAGDVGAAVRAGGDWADPATLSARLVPPFDPRLLPPDLRSLRFEVADRTVAWIDILGRSSAADVAGSVVADRGLGAYVLRVVDRDAAIDPMHHPHPHEPRRSADDAR